MGGGAKGEGAPNIRFVEVTVVQLHHSPIFIKRYFLATHIYGKYFLYILGGGLMLWLKQTCMSFYKEKSIKNYTILR